MLSSNPVLPAEGESLHHMLADRSVPRSDLATVSGVINKTGILVLVACATGALGYSVVTQMPSLMWISAITAFCICLGMGFVLRGNPRLAPVVGWLYAAVQGFFLGSLTSVLDSMLASLVAGRAGLSESLSNIGLALPALALTMAVAFVMLTLYRARVIRPTQRLKAVVFTAAGAIMLAYMAMFVLSFFGIQVPFLGLQSATQSGAAPLIGIGLSLLILGVASFMLVIDFERVEQIVEAGSPKYMEWYAAFALIVTLAWIYFEMVKLLFRLAVLLRRD